MSSRLSRYSKVAALADEPTPGRRAIAALAAGATAFLITQILLGLLFGFVWFATLFSSVALAVAAGTAVATMKRAMAVAYGILVAIGLALVSEAKAGEILGPGRFCGYSPIIDLMPGEKVTTLHSGIHSGSFRWDGAFGSLEVRGIGWASRPEGRIIKAASATSPARFEQRRDKDLYEVAIWNGGHGAAYFTSKRPINALQLQAISRVRLFEEGETPPNCDLRTAPSWE
jgi:hypothetical protein